MQEPLAAAAAALVNPNPAAAAEAENQVPLKCPRCDSMNTKFCYYNNYNLSQPRHFCKNCRRYWTKGGALRNVPVGGGTRKNSKRSSSSSSSNATSSTSNPKRLSTSSANSENPNPKPAEILKPEPLSLLYPNPVDDKMLDFTGSFSSLLQSNVQFADINLLDGFDHHHTDHSSSIPDLGNLSRPNEDTSGGSGGGDGMLNWANGWPDLAIYTPGSSFQ